MRSTSQPALETTLDDIGEHEHEVNTAGATDPAAPNDALRSLVDVSKPYAAIKERLVDDFTRVYLEALLHKTRGNQSAAARLARLDRTYFGRLLTRYAISPRRFD